MVSSKAELLTFIFFPSPQRFCLLSGLQKARAIGEVMLLTKFCVILRTNGVRCALYNIYLIRKAFLERTVVELVYEFYEKSTTSV